MYYIIDTKSVVSEILDGEAIVVHLQSGSYFSMLGSAMEIWSALLAGWSDDDIAARLRELVPGEGERIASDLATFIAGLVAEDLVIPSDAAPTVRNDAQFLATYSTPEIQKYTDMQDWMLVDPIHEVAEEGWPILGPAKS